MPLNLRASKKIQSFNVPVSYRINDISGKLLDARNVNSIQDRLETRFGYSRYNTTSLGGSVQSLSSFVKSDGTKYLIAKVGTDLISVSESGAHTVIKQDLSPTTVHRGVTGNDRHIISIGSDGLFSWNGTVFTHLGQRAPFIVQAAIASGGSLITTNVYKVAVSYYASSIGFESNYTESLEITATSPNQQIDLTGLSASYASFNGLIDKIYIYLKNVSVAGSEFLFIGQVDVGTNTYSITEESTSTQTPQTTHDIPGRNVLDLNGGTGGKYLTFFNSKLVYAGNSGAPNEVYFSEPDLPDAFNSLDTATVLPIPGQGPVTGLAVGLFNDSVLDPFLVIFKGKSTRIYSEVGDLPKLVTLSEEIGCVSMETVVVKNGTVYFLSEDGWRGIINGRFITNKEGEAITLGNGDIDDIFKSTGYTYEVNRTGMSSAFSVYYPTLDQYMTWVSEGVNGAYSKTYVYEFDIGGFKPYEFALPATCAALGENSSGRDVVLFGTSDGYIMKHSIMEDRSDVDASNAATAINAFAVLPWIPEDGDLDATYNFRELILKAIASSNALEVKSFVNYNLTLVQSGDYEFTNPNTGFTLDSDTDGVLDESTLGDERVIVTKRSDINRVGENIAIGFYQSVIDSNMGLVSMQIDLSKNGNRNLPSDNDDDEGGFNSEDNTYYPSVSASVLAAAASAAAAAASAASIAGGGLPLGGTTGDFVERDAPTTVTWMTGSYSGFSNRFSEMFTSTGLKDTLDKILDIVYAAPAISLSASPAQSLREKGTVVASVGLTANTTKFTNDITIVTFFRGATLINTDLTPSADGSVDSTYTDATPFSDTVTYSASVTDGTGSNTSSVTYTFVYPYYYGADVPGITAAQVRSGLTIYVIASTASVNRSFTTSNGDVYYFAYPASYGALSSILDENGFETIGDWTLRTENITGLDLSAVSYRIYEFNNPVVAGSTDYTFIR